MFKLYNISRSVISLLLLLLLLYIMSCCLLTLDIPINIKHIFSICLNVCKLFISYNYDEKSMEKALDSNLIHFIILYVLFFQFFNTRTQLLMSSSQQQQVASATQPTTKFYIADCFANGSNRQKLFQVHFVSVGCRDRSFI